MKYIEHLSKQDYLDRNDARPEALRLMERWADAMENLMDQGATVAEAAELTKDRANVDGITGNYYSDAADILCTYWEHGRYFKQWWDAEIRHNRQSEPNDDPFVPSANDFTIKM